MSVNGGGENKERVICNQTLGGGDTHSVGAKKREEIEDG